LLSFFDIELHLPFFRKSITVNTSRHLFIHQKVWFGDIFIVYNKCKQHSTAKNHDKLSKTSHYLIKAAINYSCCCYSALFRCGGVLISLSNIRIYNLLNEGRWSWIKLGGIFTTCKYIKIACQHYPSWTLFRRIYGLLSI